jgi:hypothetical protein
VTTNDIVPPTCLLSNLPLEPVDERERAREEEREEAEGKERQAGRQQATRH